MSDQQNTNSKIITVSFMIAAILVGIVIFVLLESTAAISTGGLGRFVSQEWVRHGFPVVIGIIAYFLLQFNKKVLVWADEVVTELRKIVWPSRRDTTAMTIMVCAMILIAGFLLGTYDAVSGLFIDWLLNHNFMGLIS